MAVLKAKEASKMNETELKVKLQELKVELIRANVTANKTNAKTKEIKKAISRILTVIRHKKTMNFNKAPVNKTGGELKK